MAGRLKGKLAVITAAGQGIGRGIAEAFIAEGAQVIATDLDVSKLKSLKKAKKIAALDARSTRAVEEFAKAAGTIGYEVLTSLGKRYHRIYKAG